MPAPQYKITSGRRARSYRLDDGARRFGPWRIEMEVQLSPLSITSDTFTFFVYKEDGDGAVERAGYLLEHWHRQAKPQPDGFPKPVGLGTARPISDAEFRSAWQQAEKESAKILKAGDPKDPVAFHIFPKSRIITTAR